MSQMKSKENFCFLLLTLFLLLLLLLYLWFFVPFPVNSYCFTAQLQSNVSLP